MRSIRVLLAIWPATAMWSQPLPPSHASVTRLVSSVAEYVKRHPQDANGYYLLGRIHYLAYGLNATRLDYYREGELSAPVSDFNPDMAAPPGVTSALSDKQKAVHLTEAVRLSRKATEIDPRNALYELGLARVYEVGLRDHGRAEWREQAIHHYLAAYQMSIEADEKLETQPLSGFAYLVSYEAGNSYARLVTQRGMTGSEGAGVQLIKERVRKLEQLPRGPMP